MGLESKQIWIECKKVADDYVFQKTGKHLNDLEIRVLQGAWEGKTYDEMAQINDYTANYLNRDVGNKLWKKLSEALGETVTKKNLKEPLQRAWKKQLNQELSGLYTSIPFPEGSVALNSPFYLERSGIESLCYSVIVKQGSLIRIKAPKLMGKTSLINRILAEADKQKYRQVYLDLSTVESSIITNLHKFLPWLCFMVGKQLNLENKLNAYWDTEILGSNDNCTVYFEEYLLAHINCPLVLALDNVEQIFMHPQVIEDFFGMLRSWHEKGRIMPIWKRLRLVIAHSTECYIPLDLNQSPFNAGVPVELKEFGFSQVEHLALLHELDWHPPQVEALMKMVGGHPFLIRLALHQISSRKSTLKQLLNQAATEAGIYSNHLRRLLTTLQESSELVQALQKVVNSSQAIELDSVQTYKLHSMGLIEQRNNQVMPRCQLYRQYFRRVLSRKQ